ncbi:MAG TPA: aminomethyl-transferring glycine dehydrogenase subunit GcvPA [Anaerolineales bacterium]|nr:aminomethyl-transferring glycine dehydrogenase subunit GcvPA [Anaerolineales bacterium]
MPRSRSVAHPYIPNSTERAREEMLREIGVNDIETLFSAIPPELKLGRPLNLPAPCLSEFELRKRVTKILDKNTATNERINFLGSGCYQHYVPAVCDEINSRNEFLTAYSGKAYEDHGRWRALFEYTSLMGEMLNMDVVNLPTYDGLQAAATAMRMAANITGRNEIVLATSIHPDKLSKVLEYNRHLLTFRPIDFASCSGEMDLSELEQAISPATAAIYFDNPNFFGVIEANGEQICDLAHRHGALCIVGADPISLGILKPPADYGADITCGDIQSLGIHMQFGGGHAGYIATRDEEKFVMEYPNRIVGIVPTREMGEYGFGEVAFQRTSFVARERGKEWLGTMANLWAITAGVYLALMGPQGMAEIGQAITGRVRYAMQAISQIRDVSIQFPRAAHFREFVVDFSRSTRSVVEINQALLKRGIFGGYDLGGKFPKLQNHAVYCVTEVHTRQDIDALVESLAEVLA